VTVKLYSGSGQSQSYAGGIHIVEVHRDAGVTGRGFVTPSVASDIMAALTRRNLKAIVVGGNPLLTDDLWRRMHEQAFPRRGGEGIVRTCMAAVDVALWDIKGKLLNAPVSALFGGLNPRLRAAGDHLGRVCCAGGAMDDAQRQDIRPTPRRLLPVHPEGPRLAATPEPRVTFRYPRVASRLLWPPDGERCPNAALEKEETR